MQLLYVHCILTPYTSFEVSARAATTRYASNAADFPASFFVRCGRPTKRSPEPHRRTAMVIAWSCGASSTFATLYLHKLPPLAAMGRCS